MENAKMTSFNGHFDYSNPRDKHSHALDTKHHALSNSVDQIMLDALMKAGFMWEEAIMLLYLREHLYENAEMRQRITDDQRMHFARWLYTNGDMHENII